MNTKKSKAIADNLKKKSAPAKEVEAEEAEEAEEMEADAVSLPMQTNYRIFFLVSMIITAIVNSSKDKLEDIMEELIEGLNSKDEDEVLDLTTKVLEYMKVPDAMIEGLFDEDEDISKEEMGTLKELISDAMGDKDIVEFVSYALHDKELPDADSAEAFDVTDLTQEQLDALDTMTDDEIEELNLDSIDMDSIPDDVDFDWTNYPSGGACGIAKKEAKGMKKTCVKGFKGGVKTFWLYPKDFIKSETGGVSASNHSSKGKNTKNKPSETRIWKASSKKLWLKSMRKHERAGSNTSKSVGV